MRLTPHPLFFFNDEFLIKKNNSIIFNKKFLVTWQSFLLNHLKNFSSFNESFTLSNSRICSTDLVYKKTKLIFSNSFLKKIVMVPFIYSYDKLKKYNKLGKRSFLFSRKSYLKRFWLGSKIHSLNFSWFFRTKLLSMHKLKIAQNSTWEKKKKAFWPLEHSPIRIMTNYFYRKRSYRKTYLSYNKLKKNFLLKNFKLRGTWSFFRMFKVPKSSFSKVRNFNKQMIKIFWRSQSVFKNCFDEKRYWTTRKFFHRFNAWYKRNRRCFLTSKHIEFWQFIISLGLCLSKRTTVLSLESGLLYSTVNLNSETHLQELKNSILTVSPQLISSLKIAYKYRFYFRRKFGKFQYTQYLNRASQWRALSKKKPKFFYNVFQAFTFNSWYFFFDFFSSSICFFGSYFNFLTFKPYITSQLPRHNLEKLNTYKLKI